MATHQVGGNPKKKRMIVLTLFVILAAMGAFGAFMFTPSCDTTGATKVPPGSNIAIVRLGPKAFKLELALDAQTRFRGLSDRASIAPDGGMLFAFPSHQVAVQGFVMRDCAIPIDIIFLDPTARIIAMHKMVPEAPRKPGETDNTYNDRLKRYSSKYASQFVIELAGNTLDSLGLKEGQVVELDIPGLKARAR